MPDNMSQEILSSPVKNEVYEDDFQFSEGSDLDSESDQDEEIWEVEISAKEIDEFISELKLIRNLETQVIYQEDETNQESSFEYDNESFDFFNDTNEFRNDQNEDDEFQNDPSDFIEDSKQDILYPITELNIKSEENVDLKGNYFALLCLIFERSSKKISIRFQEKISGHFSMITFDKDLYSKAKYLPKQNLN